MNDLEKAKDMVKIAHKALEEKMAEDIRIIEISQVTTIGDYFIIAHGNNVNQVEALVDEVKDQLAESDYHPKRIDGVKSSGWILMDYGDVIVHIFSKEDRLFYDLERIWRDGTLIEDGENL